MTQHHMRYLLCGILNIWTGATWSITSEHAPGRITFLKNGNAQE